MRVVLLPSTICPASRKGRLFATSYLVNETVAIDAGSLGYHDDLATQRRVRHLLISHSHIDHIATLPIFLECVRGSGEPVVVHANQAVIDSLQHDMFNNRVWPDLIALSARETPFLRLARLAAYQPLVLEGIRITPVPMDHAVPTFGFLLEQDGLAVMVASDTAPLEDLGPYLRQFAHLRGIFLECTFPNKLDWLARICRHMTPAGFAGMVRQIDQRVRVIAVHLKAAHHEEVQAEIEKLHLPNVEIVEPGRVYEFT